MLIVKAMVFLVIMYECEIWTIKKAKHWRTDAFELWCWRRLLDCKEIKPVNPKGNQPWLFIGRADAEVEAPLLWLTHWERPWSWETYMAGGERDDRGRAGWMASPTQRTWVWASSRRRWRTGKPGVLQSRRSQRVRHNWATEQLI